MAFYIVTVPLHAPVEIQTRQIHINLTLNETGLKCNGFAILV